MRISDITVFCVAGGEVCKREEYGRRKNNVLKYHSQKGGLRYSC